jgi:hypothetical protein
MLGTNTRHFTAVNQLFIDNSQVKYWKFQVVYQFISEMSTSALHFVVNNPPQNGSCSLDPSHGSTDTLFNISCSNWFDDDDIKDYSLYGIRCPFLNFLIEKSSRRILVWTTDFSKRLIVGFSSIPNFQVRLPTEHENVSILNMIIYIRDTFDCVTEYNMSSVSVQSNSESVSKLINNLKGSTSDINSNPFVRSLYGGNQNIIGQTITSLSQQLNRINMENISNAVSSKHR